MGYVKKLWPLVRRTAKEYSADNCTHMAAAISYYVLFSIVPLGIFLVSIFGLVVRDEELQNDVSNELVDFLDIEAGSAELVPRVDQIEGQYGPGTAEEAEQAISALTEAQREELATSLEGGEQAFIGGRLYTSDQVSVRRDNIVTDTLSGVSRVSGALTIVGLVGMAWSASAMFGAIRKSLNIAWDTDVHRPIVQQKLVDLGMVVGLGVLLGLSIAGTAAIRTVRELSDENLGPLSEGTGFVWSVLPLFLPAVFSFTVFLLIYRFVPNVSNTVGGVWPGALLATALFELLKNLFALYVANFNSYDVAYGALGGVLLFMLWTFLTSNILLLGAEVAAEYPRVMREGYTEEAKPPDPRTMREKVQDTVRGLFVHSDDKRRRSRKDIEAKE